MRKSFELLDWMKEHFKGDGGVPSVLYKFTNGLKEQGGTVSVDAGNGISVNEHTKMLEVPIGEHLSYTSQGIDAKEGDTAQKGVVQLTDAIEAHADHTTAATPAAVKEYVDANVVIGGGGDGKTYTFQEPLAEHLGAVSVADASKSAKGVVKLASEMTDAANPATAADVKAYVDAKPTGGIDLSENRAYSGKGTFSVTTSTDATRAYSGIAVMSTDKSQSAACSVGKNNSQLNAHDGATVGVVDVMPDKVEIYAGEPDSPYSLSITPNTATYAGAEIVTKSMISSKTDYGVSKLASTMTDVSNPPTAADVKKYVDANPTGGIDLNSGDVKYTGSGTFSVETTTATNGVSFISVESDRRRGKVGVSPANVYLECYDKQTQNKSGIYVADEGFIFIIHGQNSTWDMDGLKINGNKVITSVDKADEHNLGVVKLTHTVSHGEHPNEAVTPDGVAAYVDAKVANAGGFSIVKAMQATPDFKLIDGSMVQSGKLVYGVLTFTCTIQKSITNIASLPLMPKTPFTVKVVRMSNNPVEYEATVGDNGTIAFSSAQNVQTGTYTVTIAMQTK